VSVQPHPKSPHLLLVCCAGAPAALLDTRSGALTTLPFGVPAADAAAVAAPAGRKGASAPASAAPAATSSVALFSRGGQDAIVFVGSNVGTLAAVALSSDPAAAPSLRECVRLGSAAGGAGAGVRSLCLSRRGGVLLAVCADRVLRALDVSRPSQALRPLREFRDAVNKTAWRAGALSADGAYVAAASGSASEHTLHVWCRDSGTLQCVLEGPSAAGAPAALAWHPSAPLLASLGGTGRVYVWARAAAENWSAFAPDFRELEENEEYVEREDEFDAPVAGSGVGGAVRAEAAQGQSAAAGAAAAAGGDDDDTVVDVLTLDAATALGGDSDSDSDDEGALHHLPLVPELDAAPPAAEAAAAVAGEPDAAEADAVAGEEGGEEGGAKGGDDEDAAQPASKKARARA
jgi:COMPASS component SWD1